jgi:flagellar basal body rod protein FlgC
MVMQVLAIASAGLDAAVRRLEASAQRTAGIGAPNAQADFAAEAIEQIKAKEEFAANLQVIRTAGRLIGALLDLTI